MDEAKKFYVDATDHVNLFFQAPRPSRRTWLYIDLIYNGKLNEDDRIIQDGVQPKLEVCKPMNSPAIK